MIRYGRLGFLSVDIITKIIFKSFGFGWIRRTQKIKSCRGEIILKIIVIGSPGAGKSTFARRLRKATGLPLYYLDLLWHKPDQTNITREEFDARLDEIVKRDKWIIDGNYLRTLEIRLRECDTVFLMDYPLEVCLLGAESRIGKKREDLPWIETEFDEEFKRWIIDFSKDQLPVIYELLMKIQKNKEIVVFKSRKEADDYLKTVKPTNFNT